MGIVLAMVLVTLWFSGSIEIIIWRRLHVLKQSLRQSQDSLMQCYFVVAAKAGMCMYLRRFRYMDHSEVSFWPALMRSLFVFLPLKHQGDLPCGFAWREGLSESFFPVLKALLPHSLLKPWPWCLWAWWHCLKNISRKTLAIRARPADVDYVDCFLAWRFLFLQLAGDKKQ